jgi:hypothetical protein
MAKRSSSPLHLLSVLNDIEKLRRRRVPGAQLEPRMVLLRQWQSNRLARTYSDLLAQPRFRPACIFFLDDLYGARDFSQRDEDIEQMYDFMQRFVPEPLIRPLTLTVGLHYLTQDLDQRLRDVLVEQLGLTDTLTIAQYAEAYRRCDNQAERAQQIELIGEVGERLESIVKLPLIGAAMRVARGPAVRAGWEELAEFMERGYKAFTHMREAKTFLNTIRQREMRALDRIFMGHPDPFGFGDDEIKPWRAGLPADPAAA